MFQLKAATRLMADQALAPAESFRSENEENLKGQQHEREGLENKSDGGTGAKDSTVKADATAPTQDFHKTAVRNHPHPSEAADSLNTDDLPQTTSTQANLRLLADRLLTEDDPLTSQEENASDTSDGIVPNSEQGFEQTVDEGWPDPLNVEGSDCTEDADDPNVLADADPKLFNVANQPLG